MVLRSQGPLLVCLQVLPILTRLFHDKRITTIFQQFSAGFICYAHYISLAASLLHWFEASTPQQIEVRGDDKLIISSIDSLLSTLLIVILLKNPKHTELFFFWGFYILMVILPFLLLLNILDVFCSNKDTIGSSKLKELLKLQEV